MNWELYERQRATLVFFGVLFISLLLLAFQRSSAVQHVKSFLVSITVPAQHLFSRWGAAAPGAPPSQAEPFAPVLSDTNTIAAVPVPGAPPVHAPASAEPPLTALAEKSRALKTLVDENARLSGLLGLKQTRWPHLVAAHVVNRDPQRWFQEILLDKGVENGVKMDDPVIALAGSREVLVGRIVEAGAETSRAMLIYDSLSAVAASVSGPSPDDGVVEGATSHDLYLKYLSRDSKVRIGDQVVTSGLGHMFPPGIIIGWVRDIQLDERQLFLQAELSSALASVSLRDVGILVKRD